METNRKRRHFICDKAPIWIASLEFIIPICKYIYVWYHISLFVAQLSSSSKTNVKSSILNTLFNDNYAHPLLLKDSHHLINCICFQNPHYWVRSFLVKMRWRWGKPLPRGFSDIFFIITLVSASVVLNIIFRCLIPHVTI